MRAELKSTVGCWLAGCELTSPGARLTDTGEMGLACKPGHHDGSLCPACCPEHSMDCQAQSQSEGEALPAWPAQPQPGCTRCEHLLGLVRGVLRYARTWRLLHCCSTGQDQLGIGRDMSQSLDTPSTLLGMCAWLHDCLFVGMWLLGVPALGGQPALCALGCRGPAGSRPLPPSSPRLGSWSPPCSTLAASGAAAP